MKSKSISQWGWNSRVFSQWVCDTGVYKKLYYVWSTLEKENPPHHINLSDLNDMHTSPYN